MAKYSEFINFPIYLYSSKEVRTSTQAQILDWLGIYHAWLGAAHFHVAANIQPILHFPLQLCWLQIL